MANMDLVRAARAEVAFANAVGTTAWARVAGHAVGDRTPEEDRVGCWLAAGDLEIFELNRQLAIDLPEADDHHTLAGFLLERLQHIPSAGEALRFDGLQFEITAMAGPRIERVRVILPDSEQNPG